MKIYAMLLALTLPQVSEATQAAEARPGADLDIDTLLIREVAAVLSHDSLRGRGTGTPEAETAARYIAGVCERLGMTPPPPPGGTYLQAVPLELVTITDRTVLRVARGPDSAEYRPGRDFVPGYASRDNLTDFSGRAVVVGTDKDIAAHPDAYTGLEGTVAIALTLFRDSVAPGILERAGVRAIVSLLGSDEAYEFYRDFFGPRRMLLARDSIEYSMIPSLPNLIASPAMSRDLLRRAGINSLAASPVQTSLRLSFAIDLTGEPVPGHNVICAVRGSDPGYSDSAMVFTAHYDHLGVGRPDESGDSIYNGFSDNAAGVAMLLAIGKDLAQAPLRRTALFAFFVGEERGLLGSDYYVAYPVWPNATISGVINLDAGAPPAPSVNWRIAGGTESELGRIAAATARQAGWHTTTSAARANSDYYPFARKGVPAIFIIPGVGAYEGMTEASSKALKHRWDAYHKPSDEFREDFPLSGVGRYADYALRIARARDGG